MEEKMFEMMTKMYSDIASRLDIISEKLDKKAGKSDIVRLENEFDNKTKTLFDGYKQTYEKIDNLEGKVDSIAKEIEKQDVEIRVIKGVK